MGAQAERPDQGTAAAEHPYATLPARIRPEDMITEQPVRDPGDPTFGGRDPERDWLLRYAG